MSILDWGPLSRIRRNHGLEHATLQILAKRNPSYRMAGYSDAGGFWVVGDVPIEELRAAANEALARLEGGEHHLAVHPHCGTNFAAAGFLAGTAAWLAMLGSESDWRKRIERWPLLITLVTLVLILSQPVGPMLQARFTTDGRPRGMRIAGILRRQPSGSLPLHRVLTEG
jgi:hypothetical protein